jgi:hypothetical protein
MLMKRCNPKVKMAMKIPWQRPRDVAAAGGGSWRDDGLRVVVPCHFFLLGVLGVGVEEVLPLIG